MVYREAKERQPKYYYAASGRADQNQPRHHERHVSHQNLASVNLFDDRVAVGSGDGDLNSYAVIPAVAGVSCCDCGRTFRTVDALHQHQWDSADHTRVSRTRRGPYPASTSVRQCSVCHKRFKSAEELEAHFVIAHPLIKVPMFDEECTWQQIEARFITRWRKFNVKLHEILGIYKVYNPGWRRKAFEEYRTSLKRDISRIKSSNVMLREDFDVYSKILKNGNELERYHGTTVKCQLGRENGDKNKVDSSSLCKDKSCSICRILECGFLKSKCKKDSFQRYGAGIYCTSTSGKANDYVKCIEDVSQCKVMIICRVLAGRPYRTTCNIKHLKGPPKGFHSVQCDPGQVLNYDELVVYNDHAIIPEYIILYTSDKAKQTLTNLDL